MLYVINNNIVFNTEDRTLGMQQDDMSTTILSNSSNRLLYELLCSYGQTVSRDMLFQNVWDNHGLVSSNSNLNHYISQLRKSLVSFGIPDKAIITVPKMGFKFSDEIPVLLLNNDGKTPRAEYTKVQLESIDEKLDNLTTEILSETQDRDELVKDEPKLKLKQDITRAKQDLVSKENSTKRLRKLLYIVSSVAFLMFVIILSLFFMLGKKSNQNNDFLFLTNSCPIYTFYPMSLDVKDKVEKEVSSVMKDNNVNCKNDQFIMVHYVNRAVISLCSAREERSFSCTIINF